jgi:GTP-binding protein HflX
MKYNSVLCSSLEIPSSLEDQRQKGSVQQRGEGEKQIEVDRRLLRRQKEQLIEELEHVRTHRQLHRERRKSAGAPVVALVGYTNAGKSSLLNRLAGAAGLAEDRLFATLDPMTRRTRLAGGQEILLTDTVGFVQRLPTTLVAAFRATLEEVAEADLLVHVVDSSSPTMQRQVEAVEQVLEEIGAGGLPVVVALNKADLMASDLRPSLLGASTALPSVRVSALTGSGIDGLLRCISEQLVRRFAALDVLIPYDRGDRGDLLHQFGTIAYEGYEEGGTHLRGYVPANHSGPFAPSQSSMRPPNGSAPDACFRRPLPQAREAGFPGKQPAPGPSRGSLATRGRDKHVAVLLADGDPHDALLERVIEEGLHQRLGGFRPLVNDLKP